MNIILLHPNELCWEKSTNSQVNATAGITKTTEINRATVTLTDRRCQHIQSIHKAKVGDTLKVGIVNGAIGSSIVHSIVHSIDTNSITLQLEAPNIQPPPTLPVTLLLALPRPKMLRRILQSATAMGVKKIILLNSYKVEKSFWQSPYLNEERITEQLILGLEQAVDTVLPEVIFKKRFKPFVEDELPALAANKRCIIAHPAPSANQCMASQDPTMLAIGPEGGFTPYEVEKLNSVGFETVTLGPRILKVETAVPVLLSKLFDC